MITLEKIKSLQHKFHKQAKKELDLLRRMAEKDVGTTIDDIGKGRAWEVLENCIWFEGKLAPDQGFPMCLVENMTDEDWVALRDWAQERYLDIFNKWLWQLG